MAAFVTSPRKQELFSLFFHFTALRYLKCSQQQLSANFLRAVIGMPELRLNTIICSFLPTTITGEGDHVGRDSETDETRDATPAA